MEPRAPIFVLYLKPFHKIINNAPSPQKIIIIKEKKKDRKRMTYERIFIGMIGHIEYSLPVFDTVDSFFYACTKFRESTRENIKSQPLIILIQIVVYSKSFSLHLSDKLKRDSKIRDMCFSRFCADIYSSRLVGNLQIYPSKLAMV